MPNVEISDSDIERFLSEYNDNEDDSNWHLRFDEDRCNILKGWEDVQACPGSGKTTLVAAKLLILASKLGEDDGGVCVLTHTNVACNEIRARLNNHASGIRFNSYPHFIGTIQEFVNRFLALPYIRSCGLSVSRVDDEASISLMDKLVPPPTRTFMERKREDVSKLKIDHLTGNLSVPGFRVESDSQSYTNLQSVFRKRIERGYFFYSEMYYFAKLCLQENGNLASAIRKRFPIVMIDEMQDTQGFQDDLINTVFFGDDVCIQRFGDPDQAIYDNMGGENPNTSFNGNALLVPVNSTHRFARDISSKIFGLSVTQIGQLESYRLDPAEDVPHTFFLFTDDTKTSVLERYCELLEEIDPNRTLCCAKAVGATEGGGGFISEYWSEYDRRKAVKNPKPGKLISAVYRYWWSTHENSGSQYNLLIQSILDIMRMADKLDLGTDPPRHHTKTSLVSKLKDEGNYQAFRRLLAGWITEPGPDEETWEGQIAGLMQILGINEIGAELFEYLSFGDEEATPEENRAQAAANIFRAGSGREIEVGTIHSVKGETHDATLVLETKNHQFDVEILIRNLSLSDTSSITTTRKSKFARLLYVAASRPRSLLCFAAHQDRITDDQRTALEQNGWAISLV